MTQLIVCRRKPVFQIFIFLKQSELWKSWNFRKLFIFSNRLRHKVKHSMNVRIISNFQTSLIFAPDEAKFNKNIFRLNIKTCRLCHKLHRKNHWQNFQLLKNINSKLFLSHPCNIWSEMNLKIVKSHDIWFVKKKLNQTHMINGWFFYEKYLK